jgi:hypothetical protein
VRKQSSQQWYDHFTRHANLAAHKATVATYVRGGIDANLTTEADRATDTTYDTQFQRVRGANVDMSNFAR